MTIEDVAAKYNFTYAWNIYKNDDGSERIGNLYLTEKELTKEGKKGGWVISFEEGLDVILNQGGSIFLEPFDDEMMTVLTSYLIEKGLPEERIYGKWGLNYKK